jgi:fluoride exporter
MNMAYLMVFLGGGLGSLCRFGLALWLPPEEGYPWATLLANGISCVLLGILVALATKPFFSPELRLLLMTGFCGGFSTFSTFSNELVLMLRQAQYLPAGLYLFGSIGMGLLAIWAGLRIGEL